MHFVNDGCVDYDPAGVIAGKGTWIGCADGLNFVSKFLFEFEITNDVNDFIKGSDMSEWVVSQDLGISYQKFTTKLKKYCVLQKLDSVQNRDKKVNGKTVNHFKFKSL